MNNAGISSYGPIEWQPLDKFKHLADVNLWGMISVTKAFLPLVKQCKGRVVNFSVWLVICFYSLNSKTCLDLVVFYLDRAQHFIPLR